MLKQIDETKSIIIEKVLGTEIQQSIATKKFNVLFGQELIQNKQAQNLEKGWSYYKGIIANVDFDTAKEAQDYANKIMNTSCDYNYYIKHKESEVKK